MRLLQPRLKVVYFNFFYCHSILVVLCRAIANLEPGAKPSPNEIR